jgi:multiple sugar transport system substrate-binding protein
MKSSRKRGAIAGALVLLVSLAACAPEENSSGVSEENASGVSEAITTIKVLQWEPGGPKYWAAAVAAFETANPDIQVELETVPNDRYAEVQGPYITSKTGPDVMMNNAGLEMFERAGAFEPISELTRKVGEERLATFSGACLGFDVNNDCYGLPFAYQGNIMYYNKAILAEAGLDPDAPPRTWDSMDDACKAVAAIGKTCLALGMTGQFPTYWNFPEVARSFLTEDDIRSVLNGDMSWKDPKMMSILEAMAEIPTRGWVDSTAVSMSMLPDGVDLFQSGNAAFAGTIASDVANWAVFGPALGDENLGAMLWPAKNPDAPLAGNFSGIEGSVLGVTKWSKNKEAGFRFIEWMTTEENAVLWMTLGGGTTLNTAVDTALMPKSASLVQIQEIMKKPTLHIGVMLSGEESDALSRGWQEVTMGSMTVNGWSDSMQRALENSPTKNK